MRIMALNVLYGVVGSAVAISAMAAAYGVLDRITPFDTGMELRQQNIAVGVVVAGMFLAVGLAAGLTVGMALN